MQYSVSDYILDITQNSVEAGASVITLDIFEGESSLRVCIGDNGCGMDEQTLKKVQDPFFTDGKKHEKRKVGLGIPFLVQAVEATGGIFDISSDPQLGTSLHFEFNTSHIDAPPVGDLPGAFRSLMLFDGDYDLLIYRVKGASSYRVSRSELIDAVGGFDSTDSLTLVKQFFSSNEEEL